MNFEPGYLIASLIIGSIGFVLLMYGKKQSRPPHMIMGLILCVYPYFVQNVIAMSSIAIVLLAALWFAVRWGW
jgi:hypothetical protein